MSSSPAATIVLFQFSAGLGMLIYLARSLELPRIMLLFQAPLVAAWVLAWWLGPPLLGASPTSRLGRAVSTLSVTLGFGLLIALNAVNLVVGMQWGANVNYTIAWSYLRHPVSLWSQGASGMSGSRWAGPPVAAEIVLGCDWLQIVSLSCKNGNN